jgi:penicillin-binding protein 1C
MYSPLSVLPGATPAGTRIMPAGAAFIVGDMLADNSARAGTFGLASPLATRVWSAVKTGTSKDMRDNWCLGFTSRYTVGVWVGNFSGQPMRDVSGVSGAAPVWRDLVDYLHRQEPGLPPAPEAALDQVRVRFADEIEPEREEWFLPGTAVERVEPAGDADSRPRIVYPAEGLVLALDPDIPPERQRVAFLARPARADLRWKLDGELVGEAARTLWKPRPGRHRLRLEWGDGEDAQEIGFVVKGAKASGFRPRDFGADPGFRHSTE